MSLIEKYEQSILLLEEAKKQFIDYNLLVYLGNSYKGLKQYAQAEEYYQLASNLIPHKFYADYQLIKLYEESKDFDKMKKLGSKILKKEVKINSETVEGIKNEVKKLMEQNKNR